MDKAQRDQVAAQIRDARELRAWSPAVLAEHADLSLNTVRAIESGSNVRPSSLSKVLDALGIEPAAERLERETDDPDVHTILEMVRLALNVMTPEERREATDRIIRAIIDKESDNS